MNQLLRKSLIIVCLNSTLLYAWLWIANSSAPSPGKEVIFLIYLVIMTTFLWKCRHFKEVLTFSLLSGFGNGLASMAIIQYGFPAAIHDAELSQGILFYLRAGLLFAFLFSIYGIFLYILKRLLGIQNKL